MKQKKTQQKNGIFIVIDGGDGSGKATQARLLLKHLQKQKVRVKYYDFPQYDRFFGEIVGRFLAGKFGSLDDVSPYLAALPFALDRYSMSAEMRSWLSSGGWIVCNRFTSSSLAHQSARILNKKERLEFVDWIKKLENKMLGILEPDIVIYLQVPPKIARALTAKKGKRIYVKKKLDIAEDSLSHQTDSADMYAYLASSHRNWKIIKCVNSAGSILPIASIHDYVVQSLDSKIAKYYAKDKSRRR